MLHDFCIKRDKFIVTKCMKKWGKQKNQQVKSVLGSNKKAKHETLAGASAWLRNPRAFQHLKIH
jgi:hypothetical protein